MFTEPQFHLLHNSSSASEIPAVPFNNFSAAIPDHRCDTSRLDDGKVFENLTQDQRLTISIPAEGDGTLSSCKMFTEPQFHLLHNSSSASEIPAVPCQYGWVYDNSTFTSTIATEWDLVCDEKSLNKATATIFFVGVTLGAVVFGCLCNRYGRRTMLMVSYILGMTFGLASAFSTSYLMFAIMRFLTGFGLAGMSIISPVLTIPDHRCDISGLHDGKIFENLTQDQRLTISIPAEGDGTLSSCKMFTEPQFHLLHNSSSASEIPAVPCQYGWVYDNSTLTSTIATEWDLVCDEKSLNKATATIFFTGVMCGAAVFGGLSDRYGRTTMLMVSYVSGMTFGLASAFSTSYLMFAIMRFFTGLGIIGISIISSLLSMEWVDIEHRRLVSFIDSLGWTFGNLMLAGIAYLVNDWRWLVITITSPLAVAILLWRWVPESARWLIVNGKIDKAHYYLLRCAKVNRREGFSEKIKPEILSTIVGLEKGQKTYTYLDLVRTPKMRSMALKTGILWYGIAFIYYGISFNISGFGVNIYLTQLAYASIEIPAKLWVYYMVDRIGRRRTEMGALLGAGICLAVNIFVPKEMSLFRTIIATIGKGCSSASFNNIFLFTAELYPTVVRQNGMGYNSFMARVAVSMAPLAILLDAVWKPLPQVLMCAVAFMAVPIASLLPETKGKRLPETIEDVEQTRKGISNEPFLEKPNIHMEPL